MFIDLALIAKDTRYIADLANVPQVRESHLDPVQKNEISCRVDQCFSTGKDGLCRIRVEGKIRFLWNDGEIKGFFLELEFSPFHKKGGHAPEKEEYDGIRSKASGRELLAKVLENSVGFEDIKACSVENKCEEYSDYESKKGVCSRKPPAGKSDSLFNILVSPIQSQFASNWCWVFDVNVTGCHDGIR